MTIHELRNEREQAMLKKEELEIKAFELQPNCEALWDTIVQAEAGNIYRTQEDIDEMYDEYENMEHELSITNDLIDALDEKVDALNTLIDLKNCFNI